MPNKNDLGRAMNDLKHWMFRRYNGILIERSGSGYKVGERYYDSWEDTVKGIDERRKAFHDLIKRQNIKQ